MSQEDEKGRKRYRAGFQSKTSDPETQKGRHGSPSLNQHVPLEAVLDLG